MARVIIYKPKAFAYSQKVTIPLVQKTTRQILVGARRLAPHGDHHSGSGERKAGLHLKQSLDASVSPGRIITGRVGSNNNYAATVHQGSEAHRIVSSNGRMLRFKWPRGTVQIFARGRLRHLRKHPLAFYFFSVRHPGNKRPVRYLTTPMHQFGRLNGFITKSGTVSRFRLP